MDLRYVYPETDVPTLHLPDAILASVPRDTLCQVLIDLRTYWARNSEMACRSRIDAIILEALATSGVEITCFAEVKNEWMGPGYGYTGAVDYMIGSAPTMDAVDDIDSFILVVEAKREWPDNSVAQVLAEAGCLLKKRMENGKNTPVFAMLTNAYLFQFFAIDVDGIVYCSGPPCVLGLGPDGTYATSHSLLLILRWLRWFISCMAAISPRVSAEDLSVDMIVTSLSAIRGSFGPRSQ